ncbi:MAG: hypothetical protein WCC94_05110 [Candidatus Bathyarchaeia archaeon]
MTKEEDSDLKRLAEMKAYLEKKIAESEREAERLRSFLEIVDSQLAEKSFRRVKIPADAQVAPGPEMIEETRKETGEMWPISTPEGTHLADLQITGSEITLVPDPGIRYEVASPPLRAFLVARVLDPMHVKDQEAARNGQLSANNVLTYELEEDSGTLRTLRVHNYGDQRRLNELRNAMRWTVRRMYEKTLQPR